jgi:hypothetical protein
VTAGTFGAGSQAHFKISATWCNPVQRGATGPRETEAIGSRYHEPSAFESFHGTVAGCRSAKGRGSGASRGHGLLATAEHISSWGKYSLIGIPGLLSWKGFY